MTKHIRMDAFRRQQAEARERQARLAMAAPSSSQLAEVPPPAPEPVIELTIDPAPPPAAHKREWLIVETSEDDPLPVRIRVRTVLEAVAAHYQMTVLELISHRRHGPVVTPRHVAMYLARHLTTSSLSEIGRLMDGRDHSTVCHGIKKIGALIERDQDFASDLEMLHRKVLGEQP